MMPPYYKQQRKYTCSLACLRMVLAAYGIKVSEDDLLETVKKDYRKNFRNLWNPTIAKLACQYGVNTMMLATWALYKKDVLPQALKEYENLGGKMDFRKYENKPDDVDTEPLSLAYTEMFAAAKLGCKVEYANLTPTKIKTFLAKDYLIQTSIRLNVLYPGKKNVFHSIVLYKMDGKKVFYHDPTHGASLSCTLSRFMKAGSGVGAAIVYRGLLSRKS